MHRSNLKIAVTLAALAACCLLPACDDDDDDNPAVVNDVRGQVVDGAAQPLADAAIALQYESDPPAGAVADKPRTGIAVSLPVAEHVEVWVGAFCDDEVLRTLVDGELPAGTHEIVWDGLDDGGLTVPDGVYRMHVVTADGETTTEFALFYLGYQNLPESAVVRPLVRTDAQGRFAIAQACCPLGRELPAIDEEGQPIGTLEITRRVRVWAFAAGRMASGDWLTVDPETGCEVTLTLSD